MKRRAFLTLTAALGASLRAGETMAQTDTPKFKPEELEQMLAPIALYPDALLSQVMMAASYPLEVVDAARWSKANPTLKGDAAVNAVKDKEWDASVKSLVAFPDVLARMSDHLDWTRKLGDAMIAQEGDVADAIQRLRRRAAGAGNLQSTPQQTVTTEGTGESVQYAIAPASPEVVYVPSYDPNRFTDPGPIRPSLRPIGRPAAPSCRVSSGESGLRPSARCSAAGRGAVTAIPMRT